MINEILLAIGAYLIGSFSSAVYIGKYFYNIDVREHGSGNAGFTNTVRVLGWKAGVPVFIIDILKGWLAANSAWLIHNQLVPGTHPYVNLQLVLGGAAVLGHIFPIYTGFRGGKGVATLLGILFALSPMTTLICFGVFIVTFVTTRYVSLSSMIAGITYPILTIFVFKVTIPSMIFFSMIVSILLLITHQKNIERLLRKEENRAKIFRRKYKTGFRDAL
ncbi:MAG: glycerol-3-phosphate 1-O-acyltransferase PlsY [Bacteroidales bacterium]|nr:glycerol-3-phosphate 1-O-acyltransferase PlsY [Bacteroidales bacterium]